MTPDERTEITNRLTALSSTADVTARLVVMGDHSQQSILEDVAAMRAMLTRIARYARNAT